MLIVFIVLALLVCVALGALFFAWRNPKPVYNISPDLVDEAIRETVMQKVLVIRNVKRMDNTARQAQMYEPCPCGSGKKFKFCCKEKADKAVLN